MTRAWSYGGGPVSAGHQGGAVTVLEGSTFCISDSGGDFPPDRAQGLFVRDTRVLSGWRLTVDGLTPQPLAAVPREPYTADFISRLPSRHGHADSTLLVVRRRFVGDGLRERVSIRNTAAHEVWCDVSLAVDADFADLFEVKEGRAAPPDGVTRSVAGAALRIARRRGNHDHGVLVRADPTPAIAAGSMSWSAAIPPRGEWTLDLEVTPSLDGVPTVPRHGAGREPEHAAPARRLRQWRRASPQVSTEDADLATVLRRSIEDLGALRIFDPEHATRAVVAAGAPWFMALFGRDALLTSWMLLPLNADLAIGTLQTLAAHQGRDVDPVTEEEPGRILHEMRFGPAATLALGGRNVYYGTADATPLFVMLLGELLRWGHTTAEIRQLLPHADRALAWIEQHGDVDGDGFVEYQRKSSRGLVNQGWKDSWDGVTFADGRIAEPPIALAEVQGYVHAAYLARAQLAAEEGDAAASAHWAAKARTLKAAFNEAFWLPDRGWYALALDRDKRPVDALASNIGHCLWTGIVDEERADLVAERLLSPEMFTGWGIRTLAESMTAYNPMSYHNGSVWPHDNALCVAGLMRYGFVAQGQRVAEGILDAAGHFGHRLPELFCGFPKEAFPIPVPYPTSCSPQAWAAAAPLLLLRSLLRLDPAAPSRRLWCAPAVPTRYLPLRVSRIGIDRQHVTIDVGGDGWQVTGLDGSDLALTRQPRPATLETAG